MKVKEFISKNRILIIIGIALFAVILGSALFIKSGTEDHGAYPLDGVNDKRSYIALTGEKYNLTEEQEQQYLLEEKKREERIEEKKRDEKPVKEEYKPDDKDKPDDIIEDGDNTSDEPGGEPTDDPAEEPEDPGENSGGDDPGEEEPETPADDPGVSDEEESKRPTIICSLRDGETIDGAFLSFTVKGISYKNMVLGSGDIAVKLNGSKIYSSGQNNGIISYRTSENLNDGENEVVITAVDKDGNQATARYNVIINKEGPREEAGTMRVTLSADVLSLGTFFDVEVLFYEGENLPYVVDRAFQQAGMRYSHAGRFDYGFYLDRVYMTGITEGYRIPDAIQEKLDQEGITSMGFDNDSLGEKDFYEHSGWMYMLDGVFTDGFSTKPAEDGSEINLIFTLNYGYEFDGTWFNGSW
ncbi:MAG: hypothetical protein PUJ11_06720 [Eubacteriaceae bacterium]|nr:hypothetical protein [Eubacteriaceae bacterium]